MEDPILVGPDGKPVQSDKYAPCPECGRPSTDRVPSCGFGVPYLICLCGFEFNGDLECQLITP
jgi:hypothetical protein